MNHRAAAPFRSPLAALLVGAAALVAGCQSTTQPPAGRPVAKAPVPAAQDPMVAIPNNDPCATRLHDICAPLLLYFGMTGELPRQLDDLRKVPGFGTSLELVCPETNTRYVYDPVGLTSPDTKSRVIIYEPAPAHNGMRLAVAILEPQPDRPLVTKVLALPDSFFKLKRPDEDPYAR